MIELDDDRVFCDFEGHDSDGECFAIWQHCDCESGCGHCGGTCGGYICGVHDLDAAARELTPRQSGKE